MNSKFEHTKYGLILKLTAANDNERALVNELLETGSGIKLKNLVVRPGETASSIDVLRPVYISDEIIRRAGFSEDVSPIKYPQIYVLVRAGKTYLLAGCGFYTLYVYEEQLTGVLPKITEVDINDGFIFLNDGEMYLEKTEAMYISEKINLAEQLDELLLKY